MKELIRIWQDDEGRIHLDTHVSITDYQVVGLLECFKHVRINQFARGTIYLPNFKLGNDFDTELEPEEKL